MKRNIYLLTALALSLSFFTSCDSEQLGESQIYDSIFVENEFDLWLNEEFVAPYNVELRYRMTDIISDMNYNLIPADYDESILMSKLIKSLVFDVYDDVTGSTDFIHGYFPKLIHLIGSYAYNTSTGSIVSGTAEGGTMMTLYGVNSLSPNFYSQDIEKLNDTYFHTMHHEFAHILHQTKPYSTDFSSLSAADYVGDACFDTYTDDSLAWVDGFVSAYASTDANEDFVELISFFLVSTDEYWAEIFDSAGDSGRELLESKFSIVVDYLQDSWGIDIYELRDSVRAHQDNVWNIDPTL